MARDSPVRDTRRWRSRTHSMCEKLIRFPILINTDLFVVTLLILKPKCEPHQRSVAYYRCIFVTKRFRYTHIARASNSVRELPEFLTRFAGLVTTRNILFSKLWKTTWRHTKCELLMHASKWSYRSTSFVYRPLWIHFKFDSTIKIRIVTTKRVVVITRRLGERAFLAR